MRSARYIWGVEGVIIMHMQSCPWRFQMIYLDVTINQAYGKELRFLVKADRHRVNFFRWLFLNRLLFLIRLKLFLILFINFHELIDIGCDSCGNCLFLEYILFFFLTELLANLIEECLLFHFLKSVLLYLSFSELVRAPWVLALELLLLYG